MSSFFGSFLDGFTGAGLARKLTIPDEPVIGFAPSSESSPMVRVADLRPNSSVYIDSNNVKLRVVEIRFDVKSESLVMIAESASGEVEQIQVGRGPFPMDISSIPQR